MLGKHLTGNLIGGLAVAVSLFAAAGGARAGTVNWTATGAALTLADGTTLAPAGSLVRVGYFTIADGAVTSGATNPVTLNASFVELQAGAVGENNAGNPGIWGKDFSGDFSTTYSNFSGQTIFVWTFNAATLGAATQQGIDKFNATFPTDRPVPGQVAVDLTNLVSGAGSILVGSAGAGTVSTALGALPHVNMATISAPPADTTAPSLAILSPADYQVFAAAGITVSGTATDASGIQSVTVSGAPASFSAPTWSLGVTLASGTNTFQVIATDASANANVSTQTVHAVYSPPPPPPAPVAAFTGSPTTGVAALTVNFTDQSSGTISSRAWTFGDGGNSSATSPGHTYSNAGVYTVSLTVSGPGGGDGETKTGYIVVTAPDTTPPVLVVAVPTDYQVFTNAGITASGTATDASGIAGVTVNGVAAILVSANWSRTVTLATGTNTLTVVATDASLQDNVATQVVHAVYAPPPGPPVGVFAGNPTNGIAPLLVSFTDSSTGSITNRAWVFGDGGTSALTSPSHSYPTAGVYTVKLTVFGPGGSNVQTRANYIVVTAAPVAPVAGFTGSPTNGVAPLVVGFTDASTGTITNRLWQFGDGLTSALASPTHSYPTAGTYAVTLTVFGPAGSNALVRAGYVVVSLPPDTTAPVLAVLAPAEYAVFTNATILVSGTATDASGIAGVMVDGLPASLVGATWSQTVVLAVGTNTLTVIATDASPSANAATQMVHAVFSLTPPPPAPAADFAAAPSSGPAPLTVAFTDLSTGPITNRLWSFGDSATSSAVNPTHIYSNAGVYAVSLIVAGPGGVGTTNRPGLVTVTVNRPPVLSAGPTVSNAVFQLGTLFVAPAGEPAVFQVAATDPDGDLVSYQWEFGDGTGGVGATVSHPYTNCQNYSVAVRYSDGALSNSAALTVAVPCELVATSLELKLNFAKPNADSAKLQGSMDLGATFVTAGQQVTVVVGGAVVSFVLDAKGKGVHTLGKCQLKLSRTSGFWVVKVTLKGGAWAEEWAAYGLVNVTVPKPGAAVQVPVIVLVGPESFMAEPALTYTATAGKSGQAK